MDNERPPRRPGEVFLESYMANASELEHEEAYENLRALVSILVEIDQRLARERRRQPDSRDSSA
jgi:hypothetical protein